MLKKLGLLTAALVTAFVFVGSFGPVEAQSADDVRDGVNIAGSEPSGVSVESVVRSVINVLSMIVGIVAVIMIIVGGLKYITSSGDSGNVTSAKNTILYAIVGLVIVALAQVIVRYVLRQVE